MQEPYLGKIKINLKKVEGQIKLLNKMLEDKRYCIDVAQQVNAAIGILKQTNNLILESHLNTCATSKLSSDRKGVREDFVKELVKTFNLTGK
ncbi:MAG: hypothetical protein US58_C0007G0010 [Candidatus Magasanikbacteria bacterium GW2011_GWA2_37_8]|uniref:Copper-sensing transcriptional repressor CsoR n=1 Tax=Candidatus Magasanikbacteria bacterium GW2011_GWA2_37_8 TaxID=1619036 RepID=A0A0G0JVR2_9BACT|nr:MAG: hypothetical protein US58_C0007G0010 [Candidatus Magasanikbacteria bacterium GW2011_GWA2_37_8]